MTLEMLPISPAEGPAFELPLARPPGAPRAIALLAHCLPDEPDGALARVGAHLLDRGCAVAQLNCAGEAVDALQPAHGPAALIAAARALTRLHAIPMLLVGHSYGGLLALAAMRELAEVRALALLNTPAGVDGFSRRARAVEGRLMLGTQPLVLPDGATRALGHETLHERIEHLRRPLLILHAPMDSVVELSNAAQLFTAAKHPKSFMALDSGDHQLTRPVEADHAAAVLCGWAARYLGGADTALDGAVIVAESGGGAYRNRVVAGRHRALADEPAAVGGNDDGPSPYDYLCAALGACTSMTLRMYARLKKLPLENVHVEVRHAKVHASDCAECDTREGKIDRLERSIVLAGPLDAAQRDKLLEIADKCPVHRTLHNEVWVETRLVP